VIGFGSVDRALRRAMLNLLGFADILSIEQGIARSTRAARALDWGAHPPSGVDFGALAETFSFGEKVRDREGAITSTRDGCAPQEEGEEF